MVSESIQRHPRPWKLSLYLLPFEPKIFSDSSKTAGTEFLFMYIWSSKVKAVQRCCYNVFFVVVVFWEKLRMLTTPKL